MSETDPNAEGSEEEHETLNHLGADGEHETELGDDMDNLLEDL